MDTESSNGNEHIYRPADVTGVVVGVLVFLAVGVPGVVMQPSTGTATAFVVCMTFAAGIVVLGLRRVEFRLDPATRTVRVIDVRWPLRTKEDVLRLDAIASVDARQLGRSSWVEVTLHDGARVPLPAGSRETVTVLQRWMER